MTAPGLVCLILNCSFHTGLSSFFFTVLLTAVSPTLIVVTGSLVPGPFLNIPAESIAGRSWAARRRMWRVLGGAAESWVGGMRRGVSGRGVSTGADDGGGGVAKFKTTSMVPND